jgi:hypothetical protein
MSLIFPVIPLFARGAKPIEFISSTAAHAIAFNHIINVPGSVQAGDFLIVMASVGSSRLFATPTGWTENLNENTRPTSHVFTRTATGSEPASYTFSFTGGSSSDATLAMLCYRNVTGINIIGARSRVSSATTTAPGVTATKSGALLAVFATDGKRTLSTPPGGMAQRALGQGGLIVPALAVYDLVPSPSGATGNKTLIWSGSNNNVGWQIQIF